MFSKRVDVMLRKHMTKGGLSIVSLLVKYGAHLEARDSLEVATFIMVASKAILSTLVCLLDHSADVDNVDEPDRATLC
jgi:hypothetical protein